MADQAVFLRSGQDGALLEGTPGHVLTFQSDGKVKGEAPAAGGSVTPLAAVFYVDKDTTTTSPDGSIANPFPTVQQALTGLSAVSGNAVAVLITPGDYSGEGLLSFPVDKQIQLSALAQPAIGFNGAGVNVKIGPLDCSSNFSQVGLTGIQCSDIDAGFGTLCLQNCQMVGGLATVNGGVVCAKDCVFLSGAELAGQNVRMQTCELNTVTLTVSGTLVEVTGSTWTGISTVEFTGSAGELRLDSLTDFYWSLLGGSGTLTNGTVVQLF